MKVVSQFKPKGILKNPHVQTILAMYLARRPLPPLQHEVLELSDGDFLDLYFSGNPDKGLVVILHGILGDLASHYVRFSFEALTELGMGGVLVRLRGAGDVMNRTPRFFNAADPHDLYEVLQYLRNRFPHAPIFAVGFSLGGIILAKYLAEYNQSNPLTAAIAVSIPFDLAFCINHFSKYPGKFYSDYMIRNMRKMMLKKFTHHQGLVDLKEIKKVKTFPEFDNLLTAPMNGYRDANDYYQKGSPRYFLKQVRTPLLIIHALDDPFMKPDIVPNEEDLSEYVTLEVSEHGGHLGFMSAINRGKAEYWLQTRIKNFIAGFYA